MYRNRELYQEDTVQLIRRLVGATYFREKWLCGIHLKGCVDCISSLALSKSHQKGSSHPSEDSTFASHAILLAGCKTNQQFSTSKEGQ